MSQNLRSLTAEFVGTLVFVFLGAGSVVTTALAGPNAGAVSSLIVALALGGAVFGTAVASEAPKIGGFGIGLAIFVAALVGGNLTGAMMNPARAFGPAVVNVSLNGQAVYWIGPLLGAAVAAALWKAVLLPRGQ